MKHRHSTAGFTLLEVMVALTIVAIALGAMLSTSARDTSNLSYLRDKTLANWIAMNQIGLLRATRELPEAKRIEGVEFLGNKNWYYRYEIKNTAIEKVKRLDMEVRDEDRDDAPILATASSFFDIQDKVEEGEEGEEGEGEKDGQADQPGEVTNETPEAPEADGTDETP